MYHYADLAVGKPIAVYGMNLLLRAADGAAAAHYAGLGIPLELDSSDEMAASLMATSTEPCAPARQPRVVPLCAQRWC